LLPIAGWLLWTYGLRNVRLAQIAMVAGVTLASAAVIFLPYLQTQRLESGFHRQEHIFATWAAYLPYGELFPGLGALVLAGIALLPVRLLPAARTRAGLRLVLLLAAFLAAWISLGPYATRIFGPLPSTLLSAEQTQGFGIYGVLSNFLPGLDAIRTVFRIGAGFYLCITILAGIGAERLLALAIRRAPIAAGLLLAVAIGSVIWPAEIGLTQSSDRVSLEVATDPDVVEFFADLERQHNFGPVLELPIDELGLSYLAHAAPRVMATFYHRRRTSACFGSFRPEKRGDLVRLAHRLPAREAVREARRMGFTTIVIHEQAEPSGIMRMNFEKAAVDGTGVQLLLATPQRAAYALVPSEP
jgi:hypothetical protein